MAGGLFFVLRTRSELNEWNLILHDFAGLAAVVMAWLPIAMLNVIRVWQQREPYVTQRLPRGYLAAPIALLVTVLAYAAVS
jgi:hypothetical protein